MTPTIKLELALKFFKEHQKTCKSFKMIETMRWTVHPDYGDTKIEKILTLMRLERSNHPYRNPFH